MGTVNHEQKSAKAALAWAAAGRRVLGGVRSASAVPAREPGRAQKGGGSPVILWKKLGFV